MSNDLYTAEQCLRFCAKSEQPSLVTISSKQARLIVAELDRLRERERQLACEQAEPSPTSGA